ncbi:MAG: lipopolysaccharide biosynthesis protein [Ancylobacter novellus]|uniref:Lipopolysaccharide biosynthesis protein n=1 Tax=Ancylobacter novellus TaxID=921 RepID=A0A2W5SY15_ANCNO|nr:MAG: lipopolysaccharide biosynthesis protein [Ancylobacter novellus]
MVHESNTAAEVSPTVETVAVSVRQKARALVTRSGPYLRRNLLLPAFVALLASGAALQMMPPRYMAEARLLAEGRGAGAVNSRSQIISSREFARQVLEDRVLSDRLLSPRADTSGRFAALFGLPSSAPGSLDSQALRAIEKGLAVVERRDGQTSISFVAPDPRLAADIANAFADTYLRLRQGKGAFNMDPAGPLVATARPAMRAVPAEAPLTPSPRVIGLGAAIVAFGLALGFQAFLRRRRAAEPEAALTPAVPQLASSETTQHLPWIGGTNNDIVSDEEAASPPRRRVVRDAELADLSRLVELRGGAARLVVVTGPSEHEGIARCALSLGRSLASAERRVVIVCLDMASPLLDELTADPRAPGLTDLLFGVASFSDTIHREAASRCHVIPPGRGARDADGLIATDRLTLILSALEQTYDHVVVAAPPLGGVEGAQRLAGLKPTLILVTQPGMPATGAVEAFDEMAAAGFSDIAMVTLTLPEAALPFAA